MYVDTTVSVYITVWVVVKNFMSEVGEMAKKQNCRRQS